MVSSTRAGSRRATLTVPTWGHDLPKRRRFAVSSPWSAARGAICAGSRLPSSRTWSVAGLSDVAPGAARILAQPWRVEVVDARVIAVVPRDDRDAGWVELL